MARRFVGILLLLVGLVSAPLSGCGPSDGSRPIATSEASQRIEGKGKSQGRSKRNAGSASHAKRGTLAKGRVVRAKVVGVTDGDTVTVLAPGNVEVRVRLNGIDAPESKQAFGDRAKLRLSELAFGREATVKVQDVDRYGRSVGEITIGGASVNRRMVRDGYAWWYRQYARRDRALESAETEARAARRGLWGDRQPQAPWDWRKARRSK